MAGRGRIAGGVVLLVVLVALGEAARSSALTATDIRLDEHLATLRDGALTTLAKAATVAAQSMVGVAAAVLVPAVLWLLGRRRTAVHVLFLIGGSLAVAFAAKHLVHEHRPPHRLWVIPPDNAQSFPSGHTTIATALALTLVLLAARRMRALAVLVGALFAVGVAFSRMYLGVHYLPDVLGGMLSACAAALLAAGLLRLPLVSSRLDGLERTSAARHANRPVEAPARRR